MFPQAKLILIGLAALFVVTVVGVGYVHYRNVLAERDTYRSNAEKLETALSLQKGATEAALASVNDWKGFSEKMEATVAALAKNQAEAAAETRRLQDVLSQHDLSALAARKPELVERAINDGSARIGRMLECASTPGGHCATGGAEATGARLPATAPPH